LSPSRIQNLPASVRQRLLDLARQRGEDFQFVLTHFALERLLYRLSVSPYAGRFLLKGALLLSAWGRQTYRPTRDLDLEGSGEVSPDRIETIFRDLCSILPAEDGLTFDPDSVRVERTQELQSYPGIRVYLTAYLASARIPLQVDIGTGDAVTPGPTEVEYPTLLDQPAPRLGAYPPETVVAEKFQAMVFFGMANSRLKDFYDLWTLARSFNFPGAVLAEALYATFQRRQTALPVEAPIALTAVFGSDRGKRAAWKAFLLRTRRDGDSTELMEVCDLLRSFLMPVCRAAAARDPFQATWIAPGPWRMS
jgi:predicted nucleotidyltransferase component of viral defense system